MRYRPDVQSRCPPSYQVLCWADSDSGKPSKNIYVGHSLTAALELVTLDSLVLSNESHFTLRFAERQCERPWNCYWLAFGIERKCNEHAGGSHQYNVLNGTPYLHSVSLFHYRHMIKKWLSTQSLSLVIGGLEEAGYCDKIRASELVLFMAAHISMSKSSMITLHDTHLFWQIFFQQTADIDVIERPSMSPDLSSIGNIWDDLWRSCLHGYLARN